MSKLARVNMVGTTKHKKKGPKLTEEQKALRDQAIRDLDKVLVYRVTLYKLAAEFNQTRHILFVVPILILGTIAAFGAFCVYAPRAVARLFCILHLLVRTCP